MLHRIAQSDCTIVYVTLMLGTGPRAVLAHVHCADPHMASSNTSTRRFGIDCGRAVLASGGRNLVLRYGAGAERLCTACWKLHLPYLTCCWDQLALGWLENSFELVPGEPTASQRRWRLQEGNNLVAPTRTFGLATCAAAELTMYSLGCNVRIKCRHHSYGNQQGCGCSLLCVKQIEQAEQT